MAHTVANVPVNGRAYTIIGNQKETLTDVTVDSNSETVTAAELGLNAIFDCDAEINTGQATDTAIFWQPAIASSSANVVIAGFTAAGSAATVAASTKVRLRARGY